MTKLMQAAVVEVFGQPLVLKEAPVPTPMRDKCSCACKPAGSAIRMYTRRTVMGRSSPSCLLSPVTKARPHVVAVEAGVPAIKEGDGAVITAVSRSAFAQGWECCGAAASAC